MRDEKGRIMPGFSGNPAGRPKKGQALTDKLEAYGQLEAEEWSKILGYPVTIEEAIQLKILKELADPGTPINPKLLDIYLNRRYGTVIQQNQSVRVNVPANSEEYKEFLEWKKVKVLNSGLGNDTPGNSGIREDDYKPSNADTKPATGLE